MAQLYDFQADVYNLAGTYQGTVTRIMDFKSSSAIDEIGRTSLSIAMDDTQSRSYFAKNYYVIVTATSGLSLDSDVCLARFVVEDIQQKISSSGEAYYEVNGSDFLSELMRRNLGYQIFSDGSGGVDTNIFTNLLAESDQTWVSAEYNTPSLSAYLVCSGESVFDALRQVLLQAGTHFALNMHNTDPEPVFRLMIFPEYSASSVALGPVRIDALTLKTGADDTTSTERPINDYTKVKEVAELVTRCYVFGAGTGNDRVTLENATDAAPTGYTYDTATSIITNTALEAVANQPVVMRVQHFPNIKSEDDSDATANETAANQLLQAGVSWMSERDGSTTTYYKIRTIVNMRYNVGQLVTLQYSRTSPYNSAGAEVPTNIISINGTFTLLRMDLSIDDNGGVVADMVLGDVPRIISTGETITAERITELEQVVRHANSGPSKPTAPGTPFQQDAQYVLMSGSTALANDRTLTPGDGIDLTDGGAGSTATVAVDVTDIIDTGYGLTETTNNIQVNLDASGGLEFNAGATRVKLPTNHGLSRSASGLALGTPGSATATSTNAVTTTTHTHAIDSTIARSAITVTGTGSLGGGGALTGNQAITMNTPGTLTAATANSSAVANHTHAITSSATGTASTIAAFDANGRIQAEDFVVPTGGWFGLGSAAGRLTFTDTVTDTAVFGTCNVGIGGTPSYPLDVVGTGDVAQFGDGSSNTNVIVNGAAGSTRDIHFKTNGSLRWQIRGSSDAETGSNAGSDFQIVARDDTGNFLAWGVSVERATGYVGIGKINPTAQLDINCSTEDVAIVNAGSVAATEQDWIEVTVGGNTGYIRVYATK